PPLIGAGRLARPRGRPRLRISTDALPLRSAQHSCVSRERGDRRMKPLLAVLAAALLGGAVQAQQILIGQTVGLTGSAAATVAESTRGAALYIDHVNARGGVGGQKVEIVLLDDKFDPKLTLENTRTLIEQKGGIGLFMTRGTPHTQGIIPVLEQHGVPLVGPSTGAMVLHQPVSKYIFNVRAPYQREVAHA